MPLTPEVRDFATGQNFAMLTTLFDDGSPQTQVMWVDADEEHILINTEVHRAKYRNVERDPRVAVTIWKRDDPYTYVEVRGEVVETVHGEEARRHIDACSQRYRGRDYDADKITSERVVLKIRPDRVNARGL
ncbi:MAG: PPOX class F420-dependent oxidoreductase [Nitriliruptorales bacterium]|nr:PPOX class F420-dependent oxidoreductase [Nitriliruptorales bacterium]